MPFTLGIFFVSMIKVRVRHLLRAEHGWPKTRIPCLRRFSTVSQFARFPEELDAQSLCKTRANRAKRALEGAKALRVALLFHKRFIYTLLPLYGSSNTLLLRRAPQFAIKKLNNHRGGKPGRIKQCWLQNLCNLTL